MASIIAFQSSTRSLKTQLTCASSSPFTCLNSYSHSCSKMLNAPQHSFTTDAETVKASFTSPLLQIEVQGAEIFTAPSNDDDLSDRTNTIVDVISRFLNKDAPDDQFEAVGRTRLRETVSQYVVSGEKMELVFPGFPFKSTSTKKVLGKLPDLAEEILLSRLEALAREISQHHPSGAAIRIVSDGIVYQDILKQSESTAFRYGAELCRMINELGFTHVTFISAMQLLDPTSTISEETSTEEEYIACLADTRARFLSHEVPGGYDVEEALKTDIGTLRTYLGYTKFLEAELEGHPSLEFENGKDGKKLGKIGQRKARKQISKTMLEAGAKFSDVVSNRFPRAIRISCHAHGNAGPKYAFDMLPGGARAVSPWHNVMFRKTDGSYAVGHYKSFDPTTYDIIYRYGRPYYLQERTTSDDTILQAAVVPDPSSSFPLKLHSETASFNGSTSFIAN